MEYIVTKRFKRQGIDGYFNLPYGTICPLIHGFITSPDGRSICMEQSEASFTYFRQNTEEGRKKFIILNNLYDYYNKGHGNVLTDLSCYKLDGKLQNSYWKHILRTMPIDELEKFYRQKLGEPKF